MPIAHNGACELYYETFGDPANDTLLLVNGLGSQCINYDDVWCAMFADAGLHVVRFDNRDVGLSSWFDDQLADPDHPVYDAKDMAADAIAVLDAVGADRAHIHGVSMGGYIVQWVAINHPERVRSVIAVMTSTGEPDVGQSTPQAVRAFSAPPATTRDAYIDEWIRGEQAWGSPDFIDEQRWRFEATRAYDRAYNPAAGPRQRAALVAAGPTAPYLPGLDVPMLVIHGTDDTLVTPSGGQRLAELVPGATYVQIDGMGHDYPPGLWPRWTALVVDFVNSQ